MAARPGNWSLLTDDGRDPVAGDPDAVRSQAGYYATMAKTIIDEAHRLKTLGDDDELVGKYAKSLKEELHDLADEVHKAHKRYDGVATALKPYATALDTAKAGSMSALRDAEHAQAAQTKAAASPNPQATPGGKPLTADQKDQAKSHADAVKAANDALNAAKTKLHGVLTDLNDAGKRAAGSINDHNDDALKDHHHWWDVVVKIIKVLVEIANYVVIVLAIVALFIPGLDVIVLAISLAILAADMLLAATGNGSWMDVAFDIVAVITFGAGKGLEKLGERGAETALEGATKAAIKTEFRKSGNIIMRNLFGRGTKMANATRIGTRNVAEFADTFKSTVKASAREMARSGGLEGLAKSSKLATELDRTFGGVSHLDKAYLAGLRRAGQGVWGAGVTAPLTNVALSRSNLPVLENVKPYSNNWEGTKEGLSYHTSMSASEYNWNDHPAMTTAVGTALYGPSAGALAGLGG
jgi:hypothetical protein